jgi:hypothetical protein
VGGGGATPVTQVATEISSPTKMNPNFNCSTDAEKKATKIFSIYNNCLAQISFSNADFNTLMTDATSSGSEVIRSALVKDFQKSFKDDFDFVLFILNTGTDKPTGSLYGIYQSLDVRVPVRTQKLMGSLFIPYSTGLLNGPSLHEFMHEWGARNAIPNTFDVSDTGHWGIASVAGQLGGFDPTTLQQDNAGVFSASVRRIHPTVDATTFQANECEKISAANLRAFGKNANGGNSVPFANLELYTMGLLPPEQLTALQVANSPKAPPSSYDLNDVKKTFFMANGFTTYSEAQIRVRMGKYAPSVNNSQRDFKLATVVITNQSVLTDSARLSYLDQLDVMSAPFDHQKLKRQYSVAGNANFATVDCLTNQNFYTATKGKATLSIGALSASVL